MLSATCNWERTGNHIWELGTSRHPPCDIASRALRRCVRGSVPSPGYGSSVRPGSYPLASIAPEACPSKRTRLQRPKRYCGNRSNARSVLPKGRSRIDPPALALRGSLVRPFPTTTTHRDRTGPLLPPTVGRDRALTARCRCIHRRRARIGAPVSSRR